MESVSEEKLYDNLKKYFGFTKFKSDTQKEAIKCILSGKKKNVYISMPTGSGKSLCYQLTGVMMENKINIVISPLIALIKNQIDYLQSKKITANTVNSTTSVKDKERILADLKAKNSDTKFLYITPEHAATHAFQDLFKTLVRFDKIGIIAIDESHCVSEWGHDFRKDYLKLGGWRKQYPSLIWLALTATAPLIVREDIIANLNFHDTAIFQIPCFRKNLYYDIVFKNTMQDDFIELKEYINKILHVDEEVLPANAPCAIVYCRKKDTTESVAAGLRKQGVSCQAFHSGIKKGDKEEIQDGWMNGKISVIVATCAFGLGIDKATVRLVVHWNISQSISAYYQESGRAGRDGEKSYCRLYYDRDEASSIRYLLNQDLGREKDIHSNSYKRAQNAIREFEKIVDHCESVGCRHRLFTKFFGDTLASCNSMCDVCANLKQCKKNLETFHQLSATASLGGKLGEDHYDPTDLYEGGRKHDSKWGSFDYYDDGGESSSGYNDSSLRKPSEAERKDQRSFIEKQFALRKMQAASAMQMSETVSISRVKLASTTETKVAGLSISARETNLSLMISTLKNNMEKCAKLTPPEVPNVSLISKDLEDIGIELEYKCFENVKAVSIYRRNLAKEIHTIKTSTSLYPVIKNHTPKKHKSHGGDYKTIVKDLKERYGEDVINELENEVQKNNNPQSKKDKKLQQASNSRDGLNQTKISSFLVKTNIKVDNVVHASSSDDDLMIVEDNAEIEKEVSKLELVKQALVDELEKMPMDNEIEIKPERVESNKEHGTNAQSSIDRGDGFPVEIKNERKEVKRKAESEASTSNMTKFPRMEFGFQKASHLMAMTTSMNQNVKPTENKLNKKKISQMVITALNSFYYDKKIGGNDPKSLFKAIARNITHFFYEKDPNAIPGNNEIKKFISELFQKHGVISSESELKLF